jgi:PAS domain S-box-containing protein
MSNKDKINLVDGKYSIRDLVDLEELRKIFESFSLATGFTIGFLEHPSLEILIATGWRDICTKFHRAYPESIEYCLESNKKLIVKLKRPGQLVIEECENGLVDCATPIIIKGKHVATLATGQVLLKKPDIKWFKKKAQTHGYDVEKYLEALNEVLIVPRKKLKHITSFLSELALFIADLGLNNLEIKETSVILEAEINERKRAEESLKEREALLQLQFERMPIGCITWDMDFRVLLWNPAAEKIFGYIGEEAKGKHPYDLIVPQDVQPDIDSIWQRLLKGDITAHSENENITKDGHTVTCYWVNTPLKKANGEIIGVISMVQDITKRKKAEEALQASEAELHDNYFTQSAINMILSESLENIPLEEFLQKALNMILSIPWIAFEAIGSISLVEDKADALIMKAQSNIPEPLTKFCLRVPFGKCLCGKAAQAQKIQFADNIDERHEICYEGMVPHGHYSVPILSGGMTLGVLNIYLKEGHIRNQKEEEFLNTVANTLAGIIMRKHGEAEKEKLHDQLLQAQKMEAVGQLSGGIAHDFNNILTAIIGYGNLLKMEIEKDSTLSTYMKYILDSAERAANLTQDLLAFSRKQMISPKPINVNEVIKGVEKILLRLIGADIELSIHLLDKDLTVMADSTQMEHVLMNLATNARDAMPEGGNLLISSDFSEIDERFINMYGYGEKGKYAVITVSDTGVGIDEQTKDKIFEPFFTTKEVGKGTGLGLAMVYGIVKQHDGFINVYSEQGKGTTFKIYLPLIHAKITETKEIELPISKGGIETILIAEDDAMVRKFMREVLEGAGYTVIEAKDGEDAIDVFIENKDRIQLLILDVIMPKKNGKEVYETLKESSPHIKALFISGYSADILHKKGIISEGPEVILKPVSSDNLLRKIRDLLDK